MAVVALVPAAGLGTRFHDAGPKALVRLAGRPFLVHALERLAASGRVDRAVVAVTPDQARAFEKALRGFSAIPWALADGGVTRRESVAAAFAAAAPGDDDLVCVHDAARPLVDPEEVAAVIQAAEEHGAAVAACSMTDTVKRVQGGRVVATVPRGDLVAAATPQVIRAGLFRKGLDRPEPGETTDDVQLLEGLGVPVAVVLTSRWNVKITYPEDLAWAEAWLARSKR